MIFIGTFSQNLIQKVSKDTRSGQNCMRHSSQNLIQKVSKNTDYIHVQQHYQCQNLIQKVSKVQQRDHLFQIKQSQNLIQKVSKEETIELFDEGERVRILFRKFQSLVLPPFLSPITLLESYLESFKVQVAIAC